MNSRFYIKLAWTNISKNKKVYLPYVLSTALVLAVFYNIVAISLYKGLSDINGGNTMIVILRFGTHVTGIFSTIFLFYTNNYVIRQRKKSIGLYTVLGMNKRNISIVILFETLFVFLCAIVAGIIIGMGFIKLNFTLLLNLMHFDLTPISFISVKSLFTTCILAFFNCVVSCLNSLLKISFANPITLLKSENQGDKPSKFNIVWGILGFISLVVGYYISVTISSPITAIPFFFIAVIFVIIGTYLILKSTLIWALKHLKKNKSFYYHPRRFISLSGILYRIRQNATGLANICILSTALLVTLSTTVALYIGTEDSFSRAAMADYNIFLSTDNVDREISIEYFDKEIKARAKDKYAAVDYTAYTYVFNVVNLGNNGFVESTKRYMDAQTGGLKVMLVEDYNTVFNQDIKLKEDSIALFIKGVEHYQKLNVITLFGKEYTISLRGNFDVLEREAVMVNKALLVLVKDTTTLDQIRADMGKQSKACAISFNVNDEVYQAETIRYDFQKMINDATTFDGYIRSREIMKENFITLNGGLLFIGLLIGTLFTVATALVIYYKQISEGYEDKKRFEILKKVGMQDSDIKQTINTQIIMLFFLPVILAVIHLTFAFNMIKQMLFILGLKNISLFILSLVITVVVYIFVYFIFYKISSKAYYRIVNE